MRIDDHNQWIKEEAEREQVETMTCKNCGTLVYKKWASPEYRKEIGQLCGPCYNRRTYATK